MSEVGISAFVFFRMMMYANLFVMFDSNIASLGFKAFQKLFDLPAVEDVLDAFFVVLRFVMSFVHFSRIFNIT